jgi:hypothetical protein
MLLCLTLEGKYVSFKDAPTEAPPMYHCHWNLVEFMEY